MNFFLKVNFELYHLLSQYCLLNTDCSKFSETIKQLHKKGVKIHNHKFVHSDFVPKFEDLMSNKYAYFCFIAKSYAFFRAHTYAYFRTHVYALEHMLEGSHQAVIRQTPGSHQADTWQSSGSH